MNVWFVVAVLRGYALRQSLQQPRGVVLERRLLSPRFGVNTPACDVLPKSHLWLSILPTRLFHTISPSETACYRHLRPLGKPYCLRSVNDSLAQLVLWPDASHYTTLDPMLNLTDPYSVT